MLHPATPLSAICLCGHKEGYAKLSLKKYRPIAARNEDRKVFNGSCNQ
jgi:hypothetical protein